VKNKKTLISKLPKWVEYGAFVLAFVAGCINAIGLLVFEHQAVSHVPSPSRASSYLPDARCFVSFALQAHLREVVRPNVYCF